MNNIHAFSDRETIEQEAREWLIRLDGDNEPSSAQIIQLRTWVARSPAHREELLRISEFWDDANILTELSIPLSTPQTAAPQTAAPQPETQEPETQEHKPRTTFGSLLSPLFAFNRNSAIAASLMLAVALGLFTALGPQPSDATNGIFVTAIGDIQEHKLVDGSLLKINTDSQVQVDYSDGVRKLRLLRGEAHFQVSHNADWPFEVYAGKRMVKAIGTAFSVQLNSDSVKVLVSEGRVDIAASVEQQRQLQKIGSLGYAQKATFSNREISIDAAQDKTALIQEISTLAKQELSRKLSWREGYLVFDGDPLSYVVEEINRYLPTTIEIADPAISQRRIGGRFKVGQLEALFDVLESSFGIQVSRIDDQHIQLRLQPE